MTTNTKHTPGPWTTIEHSWSRIGIYAGETGIAALDIYDRATEETEDQLGEEMAANASLIAAAPDLVEALRTVLPHVAGVRVCCGFGVQNSAYEPPECCAEPLDLEQMVRAALAKAGVL